MRDIYGICSLAAEYPTIIMNGYIFFSKPCNRLAQIHNVLTRSSNDYITWLGETKQGSFRFGQIRNDLLRSNVIMRVNLSVMNRT